MVSKVQPCRRRLFVISTKASVKSEPEASFGLRASSLELLAVHEDDSFTLKSEAEKQKKARNITKHD